MAANLLEVRPTIMTAVPRLYETMHQRILRQIEREGGMKAQLFFAALQRSAGSASRLRAA